MPIECGDNTINSCIYYIVVYLPFSGVKHDRPGVGHAAVDDHSADVRVVESCDSDRL